LPGRIFFDVAFHDFAGIEAVVKVVLVNEAFMDAIYDHVDTEICLLPEQ
jgi:hypothetical protein